jgi:uncharacterized protein (TIGR01777 family)
MNGGDKTIIVSGSSGLVGSALVPLLERSGRQVVRLVRRPADPRANEVFWNPEKGTIAADPLEGAEAAVHLAGENVAGGRWTAAKRERIRNSRIVGTRHLCEALAGLQHPPRSLVCASAVGIYGDRGEEVLSERSAPGRGFLADVCRGWEEAADPAREAGIRVVHLRIGLVLSRRGGALAAMLPLFRKGLGGRIGSGRQYMSWISLEDLAGAIHFCLDESGLEGPVNAVAPRPVTNREFTRVLGRVLKRPALLPAPSFALRLMLGRMADELLLASVRVEPAKLLNADFSFRHVELEEALHSLLGGGGGYA